MKILLMIFVVSLATFASGDASVVRFEIDKPGMFCEGLNFVSRFDKLQILACQVDKERFHNVIEVRCLQTGDVSADSKSYLFFDRSIGTAKWFADGTNVVVRAGRLADTGGRLGAIRIMTDDDTGSAPSSVVSVVVDKNRVGQFVYCRKGDSWCRYCGGNKTSMSPFGVHVDRKAWCCDKRGQVFAYGTAIAGNCMFEKMRLCYSIDGEGDMCLQEVKLFLKKDAISSEQVDGMLWARIMSAGSDLIGDAKCNSERKGNVFESVGQFKTHDDETWGLHLRVDRESSEGWLVLRPENLWK